MDSLYDNNYVYNLDIDQPTEDDLMRKYSGQQQQPEIDSSSTMPKWFYYGSIGSVCLLFILVVTIFILMFLPKNSFTVKGTLKAENIVVDKLEAKTISMGSDSIGETQLAVLSSISSGIFNNGTVESKKVKLINGCSDYVDGMMIWEKMNGLATIHGSGVVTSTASQSIVIDVDFPIQITPKKDGQIVGQAVCIYGAEPGGMGGIGHVVSNGLTGEDLKLRISLFHVSKDAPFEASELVVRYVVQYEYE